MDGLSAAGFPVVVANPAAIEQYNGLKHADDKSDAFFLAELQRLGILPTGYIYNADLRLVRDLLPWRHTLVPVADIANTYFQKSSPPHHRPMSNSILEIEKELLKSARRTFRYDRLRTLPGIGGIQGLTIFMEV